MNLKDYLKDRSQQSFADLVGVSQMAVSGWMRGEKQVRDKRVIQVCKATDWKVTPHELRPDLYPHPHDGLPEHMRVAA